MSRLPSAALRRAVAPAIAVALAVSGAALLTPAGAQPAERDTGFGSATVERSAETGAVSFVGTEAGEALASGAPDGSTPGVAARRFVTDRATQFGLRAPRTTLSVTSSQEGVAGGDVVRLQQKIDGLPVMGGQFVVTLDAAGDVQSAAGEAAVDATVDTSGGVSAAAAGATAVTAVAKHAQVAEDSLRVVSASREVFDPRLLEVDDPFGTRTVWVVEVRGTLDVGRKVVVDAATGTVVLAFDVVHAAKNRTVCDANNSAGHYPCTSPVWTESSQPANSDLDVRRAFEFAGDTYDFFWSRFGRDSLNGAGMPLKSTVDYCPDSSNCPYENAFWDGAQMVYGDKYASADDVVGHELAHGVTEFTSHLFYFAQSGAINESMSDIFGEFVDQTNGAGNDAPSRKWLLGEDLPGGALRNMKNPPATYQPDRMRSRYYWKDYRDEEGVHMNSGVGNKAAYLMTAGGTFNGQRISAIGLTKTARLFYTTNSTMLTSASNYADLARGLRQACTALVSGGVDGFVPANCTQVGKVIKATQMDLTPPAAAAPRTASVCPTGRPVVATAWSDDLETPSGQFVKQNLSGAGEWYYPQNTHSYAFDATWATSGSTNIWGYNRGASSDSAMRMSNPVTVPANGFLHFRHAFLFEYNPNNSGRFDGGVVEYSTNGSAGPWTDAKFADGGTRRGRWIQRDGLHRLRQPVERSLGIRGVEPRLRFHPDRLERVGRPKRDVPLADRHRRHARRVRLVHRQPQGRVVCDGAEHQDRQEARQDDAFRARRCSPTPPPSPAPRSSATWTARGGKRVDPRPRCGG